MKRIITTPRNNWQAAVEELGFGFHTTNVPYWDESVYYEMDMSEIRQIEKATAVLWELSLGAVQHVIDNKLYGKFRIPDWFVPQIEKSWDEDQPSIYGRFDLCCKNGEIKMLEFNADTPTSLYEAGIVQWFWLRDLDPDSDQFNSIHEKMIAYWKYLHNYLKPGILHFACLKETLEDLTNLEYIRDCAIQAGIETKLVFIDDLGWDDETKEFTDLEGMPITNIFKLYPWEWILGDAFGKHILQDTRHALWIEPAWKMILSNKAILPVLWQLHPDSPYLLPAYFEENKLTNYVKKPILSREGANIDLVMKDISLQKTAGNYGAEGFVYQELFTLPNFSDNYPVIGSWIVGQEPAGIGIRESSTLITDNHSRFVPHLIV